MFDRAVNIVFYVNLAVLFCAIVQSVCICVLCKKTVYCIQAGLTSVFIFGFAVIAYVIQLALYTLGNGYAPYSVYATLALFGCGFIACTVYCFALGKRSNKILCRVTGISAIAPPIGTAFIIRLSYKLRGDTRAQGLVFNGYTYTIAALRAFSQRYRGSFIDAAGAAEFESLSPREARKYVRRLKKNAKRAKDGEGWFKYGEAVAHYMPEDMRLAVKAMQKSAKRDCPSALFNLGYMYETETYFKRDVKKATEFYRRAAALGDKDAELRLGIIEVGKGNADAGAEVFRGRMSVGDEYAQFNLALCTERGDGVPRDEIKAVSMYAGCAKRGMFVAQRRLFALAAESVNTADRDALFREIAALRFDGEFACVLAGVVAIKEKRASDAAVEFLEAIKHRGAWEGIARLFVGTLYLDCGKLDEDRKNGAAYIRTAVDMTPLAREVYFTVPAKLRETKAELVRAAKFGKLNIKPLRDGQAVTVGENPSAPESGGSSENGAEEEAVLSPDIGADGVNPEFK